MTLAIIFDSVGFGEWFVLLAVILIVVGPKRLPATARKFGHYYGKFRRAAESFKRQLMDMDTEFTNAVNEAEQSAEQSFSDVADEFVPPADERVSSDDEYMPPLDEPVAAETTPVAAEITSVSEEPAKA